MKKTMLKIVVVVVMAVALQSCGGLAAGMVNRMYLEENTEQYVALKMAELKPLGLTMEQASSAESAYVEEITALKENAHREKTKEISNKASLNNIRYYWFRAESKLQNLLTPQQLSNYRNNDMYKGLTEKQFDKESKKLAKMGYEVTFKN